MSTRNIDWMKSAISGLNEQEKNTLISKVSTKYDAAWEASRFNLMRVGSAATKTLKAAIATESDNTVEQKVEKISKYLTSIEIAWKAHESRSRMLDAIEGAVAEVVNERISQQLKPT